LSVVKLVYEIMSYHIIDNVLGMANIPVI
jgi:hypothetical protein